jgi:hypothetical protein
MPRHSAAMRSFLGFEERTGKRVLLLKSQLHFSSIVIFNNSIVTLHQRYKCINCPATWSVWKALLNPGVFSHEVLRSERRDRRGRVVIIIEYIFP